MSTTHRLFRWGRAGLVVVLAACGEGREHAGEIETVQEQLSANTVYVVRSAHARKCLDVQGASQADGAAVHQWDCHRRHEPAVQVTFRGRRQLRAGRPAQREVSGGGGRGPGRRRSCSPVDLQPGRQPALAHHRRRGRAPRPAGGAQRSLSGGCRRQHGQGRGGRAADVRGSREPAVPVHAGGGRQPDAAAPALAPPHRRIPAPASPGARPT